jgi:hypothetical protein
MPAAEPKRRTTPAGDLAGTISSANQKEKEREHEEDRSASTEEEETENGLTMDELARTTNLSANLLRKTISLVQWDLDADEAIVARTLANTIFVRLIYHARLMKWSASMLHYEYKQEFEHWSIESYGKIDRAIGLTMVTLLEQTGIELPMERAALPEKLQYVALAPRTANSRAQPQARVQLPAPIVHPSIEQPAYAQLAEPLVQPAPRLQTPFPGYNVRTSPYAIPYAQTPYGTTAYGAPQQSTPPRTNTGTPLYLQLPPRAIVNGILDPQKFTSFQKSWDKNRSYTGEMYDILADKVRLFLSMCTQLGIAEDQWYAVFPSVLRGQAEEYYISTIGLGRRFDEMYAMLDAHFNTPANHNQYWADWTSATYQRTREEFPEKTPHEALSYLLNKLRKVQRALGPDYQGDVQLRTAATRACNGVRAFNQAILLGKPTCEGFFADLHAALRINGDSGPQVFHTNQEPANIGFVDRRYYSNANNSRGSRGRGGWRGKFARSPSGFRGSASRSRSRSRATPYRDDKKKKCFVCGKEGCWSSEHPQEERDRARRQYNVMCDSHGQEQLGDDDFELLL